MTWVVFAVLLILNAFAAVLIAGMMIVRDIRNPGSTAMKGLFVALALWTFFYALITISPTLESKLFWLKMENIGIVATPPIWFLFTLCYTRQAKWLNKFFIGLLFLIPAITLILLFFDPWFHFYYANVTPVAGLISPLAVDGFGWYYIQLVYSYILLLAGLLILIWHLFAYREIFRKRVFTLLAAFFVPVALNLFYHMGGKIFPAMDMHIDLAPISLTITASLLSFAIFNQKIFESAPIARSVVLDYIVEMVLVVGEGDYVLDANQATANWLEHPIDEIVGEKLEQVLTRYPKIVDHYKSSKADGQFFYQLTDPDYMIEMTISPILGQRGEVDGRVLVLHDVAEQRQMENDLKEANEELKAKLNEIEKLQTQLQEQAIRDPLTGLYNRRYLAEALEREMAQAERENHPVSAIIMDVDHFKDVNDKFGHRCGDYVLEYLSKMLLANTRRGDTVCRYGGEEFVILMPKVGVEIAFARAESWRKAFANATIEYEGHELQVQFSAGVACYPVGVKDGEDLLKAADQALYYSKEHGRNCVHAHPLN